MDVYWFEQNGSDVPFADDWLGLGEKLTLSGLRFARRRSDWRLGRWTAKRAVTQCAIASYPLPEIEIRAAASGSPEVFVRNERAQIAISLSHRGGMGVCAVATGGAAVGCDLESDEERSDAFVSDFFTARERCSIEQLPPEPRTRMVNVIWSAKESALKALGVGLRLDTRSVAVAAETPVNGYDANEWHPLSVAFEGRILRGWWSRHGSFVRTLVTAPDPSTPIVLHAGSFGRARAASTT